MANAEQSQTTTVPLSRQTKRRLERLCPRKSQTWDSFLDELADVYEKEEAA